MAYKDKRGYKREHSNAVHRHRAYHHIYLKNRKKYPLPFEAYEVHHIDGDKNNNRMDNLAILTPEEHDKAHEEMEQERKHEALYGISSEEMLEIMQKVMLDYNIDQETLMKDFDEERKERFREFLEREEFDDYEEEEKRKLDLIAWEVPVYSFDRKDREKVKRRIEEVIEKYSGPDEILIKTWENLLKRYKEEKREKEEGEEEKRKFEEKMKSKRERNEKIKNKVMGFFKKK